MRSKTLHATHQRQYFLHLQCRSRDAYRTINPMRLRVSVLVTDMTPRGVPVLSPHITIISTYESFLPRDRVNYDGKHACSTINLRLQPFSCTPQH